MRHADEKVVNIPLAEWIVAAVGLLLVLVTFGYLAVRMLREQSPPSFHAKIESVSDTGNQFLIKVVVENTGGTPVADLCMRAVFEDGQAAKEVTLSYLPSHSDRRVGFVLDQRPTAEKTSFEFVSYTQP